MEAEISKYSNGFYPGELVSISNIPTYQMIKTAYRKNHDKLQTYLSICKIKEWNSPYKQEHHFSLVYAEYDTLFIYRYKVTSELSFFNCHKYL